MADILEVTGKNWEQEVLRSNQPVLVDFWAPWCGPCKRLAPVVEELAHELAGQVKVAKLNIQDEEEVGTRYGVMSIPTLIVFKGGEVVDQIVGLAPKAQIRSKLDPHLA
jgi:thioredoxin 1